MKKVTTNITFGQILFILFIFLFASFIFFYLGTRFGSSILNISKSRTNFNEPILPDEKMAKEIKEILKSKKHDFVFYDALQTNTPLKGLTPKKYQEELKAEAYIPQELVLKIKMEMGQDKNVKKEKKIKKALQLNVKSAKPTIINSVKHDDTFKQSFCLQMGSYSKKKKAKRARAIWKKRGYNVNIISFKNKDKGRWYRLRLGGYANLNDAVKAKNVVMKRYRQSARIVNLR